MAPDSPTAFFVAGGDGTFVASAWTRGPWDTASQHGGPPSALLARAVDALLGQERDAWIPVRTVVEILRPVPIAVVRPRAHIDKRGRTALRAHALLEHEGQTIAVARVVMLRSATTPTLARGGLVEDGEAPFPPPERWEPYHLSFFLDPVGYHRAMEIRMEDTWPSPHTRAWSRMRVPLVEGEEPSGWERALCFADAAHGVAPGHDPRDVLLINPDLELSLHRRPRGEWIGLHVRTQTTAVGTGLTRSHVVDRDGPVGAASAALVVRPR